MVTTTHKRLFESQSNKLNATKSTITMSSESKIPFDEYEWEQDEEWQVLIKKLEFPGSFDEAKKEKHILKRKQKYYKEKVDPDFVPT